MKELQELTVSSEIRDGSTSRVGALESDTARVSKGMKSEKQALQKCSIEQLCQLWHQDHRLCFLSAQALNSSTLNKYIE